MKTTTIKNRIVNTIISAAALGLGLAALTPNGNLVHAQEAANAAVEPKVIAISAKKFAFTPSAITLKKGEPVILRLTSADRVHGFMSKPLKIDTDIAAGKTTDVTVTPSSAGNFTVICDHYCGTGHGNMKMKVAVVEYAWRQRIDAGSGET
jgi:cytochrome c oxidase subunit 2